MGVGLDGSELSQPWLALIIILGLIVLGSRVGERTPTRRRDHSRENGTTKKTTHEHTNEERHIDYFNGKQTPIIS